MHLKSASQKWYTFYISLFLNGNHNGVARRQLLVPYTKQPKAFCLRVPLLCSCSLGARSIMPGIRFCEVRSRICMAQVLELLGFVARENSGTKVRGPCPVHGSTSPTSRCFSAHLSKHIYRCFRCGSCGNQLDLYAAATRQSLFAAALDLCTRIGCGIPWINAK